jgi:hypothetical protein
MVQPIHRESIAGTVGGTRIDFSMGPNRGVVTVNFSNPLPKIPEKLIECFVLCLGGKIAIEISNQADADRNIVKIVTVDVTARELNDPAIANLNLAVARRAAIANNEVICQSIWHAPDPPVVIVEYSRVPLSRAAVMDNQVLPAAARHSGVINRFPNRRREVFPLTAAAVVGWDLFGLLLGARFLNHNLVF